jgi:hypothetical protein
MKKHFWKVWMRPNPLTKDVKTDYFAVVSTSGHTLNSEDIARAIKREGSELQVETILDIIGRVDRWKHRFLLDGFAVQDGTVRLTPRVKGSWSGSTHVFDPAVHKLTVDATPVARLTKSLERDIGLVVLGERAGGGALIGLVTDITTGKIDGTLTPGGNLIISGKKIKVVPAGDPSLGVRFVAADGTETPLDSPLVGNTARRVVCRVPTLAPGAYLLKIMTSYGGSSTMLKKPRTVVYELPLKVKDDASPDAIPP